MSSSNLVSIFSRGRQVVGRLRDASGSGFSGVIVSAIAREHPENGGSYIGGRKTEVPPTWDLTVAIRESENWPFNTSGKCRVDFYGESGLLLEAEFDFGALNDGALIISQCEEKLLNSLLSQV